MSISSRLTQSAFNAAQELTAFQMTCDGAGALVMFEGIARPTTKAGEPLDRLILEWHPRMTETSLAEIAADGAARFAVHNILVIHRCGAILPGESIVMVAVSADHRRAAFEAADYLMDRLKTDAMFWKREEGPFGRRWIEPTERDQIDRQRWKD